MATKRELIDDEDLPSLVKKQALDSSIRRTDYLDDENLIDDVFRVDIVKNDYDFFEKENDDSQPYQDSYKVPLQPDSSDDITSTSPGFTFFKIEPGAETCSVGELGDSIPGTSNPRNLLTHTSQKYSIIEAQAGPSQPTTSRGASSPLEEMDFSSADPDELAVQLQMRVNYPKHPIPSNHKRKASTLRCVVEKLLEQPFASEVWSDHERLCIIQHGKPEIKLSDFEIFMQPEEFKMPNNFLKKVPWMTGCLKHSVLVCWPCIIAGDGDIWATGYSPTSQLMQDSIHHNSKRSHLRNVQTLINLTRHYGSMAQSNLVSTTQGKAKNSNDLIDKLITYHFLEGYWTEPQRRKIISNGKPTPQIPGFKYAHFQKNRTYVRSFNTEHYSNIVWLTGSAQQKKLFCWPCVLFCHSGTWGQTGFNNLSNLSAAVSRHEISTDHLTASLLLKAHEAKIRMEQPDVIKLSLKNKQELLKYLTDAVYYMKTSRCSSLRDDYLELLKLMGRTDPKVNGLLIGNEAEINNYAQHLTIAIDSYLKARLTHELAQTAFISIILSKVACIDVSTHIAFIVRYVNESGVIKERFVTYIVVTPDTTSDEIIKNVCAAIVHLQCASRVVGYTYDGCFSNLVDMATFHNEIKKLCQHAFCFPHKDFNLMHMVEQVLSRFVDVRDFFFLLSEINRFMSQNKTALLKLDEELVEKLSKETDVTLDLVLVLAKNYKAVLRIFKAVAKKWKSWPNQDVLKAKTFAKILLTIQCRFKIILLHEVMPALTKLSDDFQSTKKFHRWGVSTMQLYSDIMAIKTTGWSSILSRAITLNGETEVCVDETISNNFVICFEQVLDTISQLALDRACDLDSFAYYDIVCNDQYRSKKESALSKITVLPEKFQSIQLFWPSFDSKRLIGFMNFAFWEGHVGGVTLLDKFNAIRLQRLIDTLPDLYKFLKLIFTIPMGSMDDVHLIEILKKYAKERHQLTVRDTFLCTPGEYKRDGRFYSEIRDNFIKSMNM